MNSIRSRLLLWQISAVLLTAMLVSVVTYRLAWDGFNQVRDYGLVQIAHSVLRHDETPVPKPAHTASPMATLPDSTSSLPAEPDGEEEDLGQFVSQVWSAEGELIYASLPDDGPPLQQPGFHIVQWQDQSWRVYTLPSGARAVQVAVTSQDRDNGFSELVPWILVPLGVLVLVLGVLIHAAVSRALRPLENLRQDIGNRTVSELHAVSTNELPEEVAPLAHTLNALLGQLDALLVTQRQFVADAAHELNTPLAAIKLQAQLARRAQDTERAAALDELDRGIERAIHLVAQLLQIARLEPEVHQPERVPVALDALMRQTVVAFSPQAEARGFDLGLDTVQPAQVLGDPHTLRVLLDNLVDNALHYCPPGTRVDLTLHNTGAQAILQIRDSGPGISQSDRHRVLERFVRLAPGETTGSGLGLAIVREIAQRHGTELHLEETPGGGLTVRLVFPLAPAVVTVTA